LCNCCTNSATVQLTKIPRREYDGDNEDRVPSWISRIAACTRSFEPYSVADKGSQSAGTKNRSECPSRFREPSCEAPSCSQERCPGHARAKKAKRKASRTTLEKVVVSIGVAKASKPVQSTNQSTRLSTSKSNSQSTRQSTSEITSQLASLTS
jgi:hypothetical protein